jgi:hypothetical protein
MTIRTHVPLPVRLGVAIVALSVAVGVGAWLSATQLADARLTDQRAAVARLSEENAGLKVERDRLREASSLGDSSKAMEHSTVTELGAQIARLETENAKLKEDVAFFEGATADRSSPTAVGASVAIRRFQITQDKAAHTTRYRILLTQDSKAKSEFAGDLQLVLTLVREGKTVTIVVPDMTTGAAGASSPNDAQKTGPAVVMDGDPTQFRAVFRSYKRMEGTFRLAADVVLKAVQAKVLERGAVRAQQSVPVV